MGRAGSLGGGTRRCRSRLFVSHPARILCHSYGAGGDSIRECLFRRIHNATWDAHQASQPR